MITLEQQDQIELYLKSKKLSPPILDEIKDHFVMQIGSLMENEDLGFQEAFLMARISWKRELEMVRADLLSFKKIARIEKQVVQMRFRKITLVSMVFSGAGFLLLQVDSDLFMNLQTLLFIVWIAMLLYNAIRKGFRVSNYASMNFHPLLVRTMLAGLAVFYIGHGMTADHWEILDLQITKLFCMYALAVQLQLLYFSSKKINVLV